MLISFLAKVLIFGNIQFSSVFTFDTQAATVIAFESGMLQIVQTTTRVGEDPRLAVLIRRGINTQGGGLLPGAAGANRIKADRNNRLW